MENQEEDYSFLDAFEIEPDLETAEDTEGANIFLDLNNPDKLIYKVYYSKHQNGKLECTKLGLLIATDSKLELIGSDFQQVVENVNTHKSKVFLKEQTICIGSFEIDIEKQFPVSEKKLDLDYFFNDKKPKKAPKSSVEKISERNIGKIQIPIGAIVLDPRKKVYVEAHYSRILRPYQKEGVQFMYDCISGTRNKTEFGCILADSMGLGKTLMTLTLIYTLIKKNAEYHSFVKKVLIITPATLIENWGNEIHKWFGSKLPYKLYLSKNKYKATLVDDFIKGSNPILIIGYESLNRLQGQLNKSCDLIICDEAHRLKNHNTISYKTINSIETKRRIILTGTPLQNYIQEFFNCVNLVNDKVLGPWITFKPNYVDPILKAQEPNCSEDEVDEAKTKSIEIWRRTQQFILRRTCKMIEEGLPPRHEYVIFVPLLPLQEELYLSYLKTDIAEDIEKSKDVFALITALKKVANHPDLIFKRGKEERALIKDYARALKLFPDDYMDAKDRTELSNKVKFVLKVVQMGSDGGEKVIVASYWKKVLDIIQEALILSKYDFLRLDGSTPLPLRKDIITQFNEQKDSTVLLLSCKAGGTGLNIVGASRMVIFDANWNPKNDQQAMGRIWRPGQTKEVHIYRLVTIGTIEEKIYQRQITKENISLHVVDQRTLKVIDSKFLKEIFFYKADVETISQGDEPEELKSSWLEELRPFFKMVKEVPPEWEKVEKEEVIPMSPEPCLISEEIDWTQTVSKRRKSSSLGG